MAEYYRAAFELGRRKNKFNPYPLLNWLTGELAQDWQKDAKEPMAARRVPEFADLLTRARSELASSLAKPRNFWTAVMQVDIELVEALFEARLDGAVDSLAAKYLDARKLASPREFESVLDQLEFLIRMAASERSPAKALTSLHRKLK
jgi:hypothetical protein